MLGGDETGWEALVLRHVGLVWICPKSLAQPFHLSNGIFLAQPHMVTPLHMLLRYMLHCPQAQQSF